LHLFGAHRAAEVLIADLDERPVGFALFFPTFSTFLGKPGPFWLEDCLFCPSRAAKAWAGRCSRRSPVWPSAENYGGLNGPVLDWNEPGNSILQEAGRDSARRLAHLPNDRR